jgi:hypothetical protein
MFVEHDLNIGAANVTIMQWAEWEIDHILTLTKKHRDNSSFGAQIAV